MKHFPLYFLPVVLFLSNCAPEEKEIKSDSVKTDSAISVVLPATDSLLKKDTVIPPPPPPVVFAPPAPRPEPYPEPKPLYIPEPPPNLLPLDTTGAPEADEIFVAVDHPAEFPGGEAAMRVFINKNVRYPQMAVESGIEGKVVVSFVVEKDGTLSNFKVVRSAEPILDKEALRVVKLMPNWNPASHNGKAVRMSFNLPVNFDLN